MTIGRIPSVEGGIQPTIVDAKGDLIAATAADTVNRLAVGSNDQVLVADSSASTGLAWKSYGAQFVAGKNKIINGDFSINQRGFSSTTTNGAYMFDRWTSQQSGQATYSAQTFTAGTAPVSGYESTNFIRVATTGQTTQSQYTVLEQRIEDVRTFAGQTITISFWAKASSGTPYIWLEYQQGFGSGGSSTVYAQAGSTQTISTSWARYSVTLTLPSISGKTIGTNNSLNLMIFTSCGSSVRAYTNATYQNATIDFWGVQVEAGSVATPFTTATGTIQGELAACQRYYWRTASTNSYAGYGLGYGYSTTQATFLINLPTQMRVAPTSIDFANLGVSIEGSAPVAITALAFSSLVVTSNIGAINATVASGLTTNRPYSITNNNNTAGYLGFSAEL